MYGKILVPLDESQRSEAILPHAENLARHGETQLVLASVVEPQARSTIIDLNREKEVRFQPRRIEQTERYLTGWRDRLRDRGIASDILVLSGTATDGILHAVEQLQPDLLAMCSHGRTGLARAFHGSVAAGVFNRVQCPLLLVRAQTEVQQASNDRILVALDGSQRAEAILPHAQEVARRYGAQLTLLRVLRTNYQTAAEIGLDEPFEETATANDLFDRVGGHQEAERVRDAQHYLRSWHDTLRERGFAAEARLLFGQPIEAIAAVADSIDADLIAMTSHGQSGWTQAFYGSVASGTLHRTARPLLLVRADG